MRSLSLEPDSPHAFPQGVSKELSLLHLIEDSRSVTPSPHQLWPMTGSNSCLSNAANDRIPNLCGHSQVLETSNVAVVDAKGSP